MQTARIVRFGTAVSCLALGAMLVGCEGWNRKHDYSVADVTPPADDAERTRLASTNTANFADMVEQMMATRQEYLNEVKSLQKAYLDAGDSVKANWCRRLVWQLDEVLNYPFLSAAPAEHRVDVSPVESNQEADRLYDEAVGIYKQVALVPLAGALEVNKEKARNALVMFKRILKEYPKSDKVDDAAFYCGEIYKEYLREEDPDDELSVRYYQWAAALDPDTPHPARFQCAVVYDFRRHDRAKAIELYHQVMERDEANNQSNARFAATRVEQLTDEEYSHLKPEDRPKAVAGEPRSGDSPDASTGGVKRTSERESPLEPTPTP